MKKEKLVLQKGESISFLDYTIQNCKNDDGLVLFKKGRGAFDYECHLGNYGEGTKKNVENCKRYALYFFMLARPETFAHSLVNKLNERKSGTHHEFFLLKEVLEKEKIKMPPEITEGDGINFMIYFNGKHI